MSFHDFSEFVEASAAKTPAASSPTSARPASSARPSGGATTGSPRPAATSTARTAPPSGPSSGGRPADRARSAYAAYEPYARAGMDLFRLGSRLARQYGRSRRASAPAAAPAPAASAPPPADHGYGVGGAYQPATGVDQLAALIQALQQREIPALPGHAPAPAAPAAAPQTDALALLRVVLSNPQFQQSLQQAATSGPAAPRTVPLPVPVSEPGGPTRPVPIPLGAVMNAIVTLAGQSMTELNAMSNEDDPEVPEYLVSEDGEFIVDPASPEERAALVTHWFRVSDQTRQGAAEPQDPSAENELDDSDAWARAAGFMR